MSATNRGSDRSPLDFYATPEWVTRALLHYLPSDPVDIVDAGCGTGAIGRVLREKYPHTAITGVELDPGRVQYVRNAGIYTFVRETSFLEDTPDGHDLCVMNPPFCLSFDFVRVAVESCRSVAALLPLNFKASKKRADWVRDHKPFELVLPSRPSFCHSFRCKNRFCAEDVVERRPVTERSRKCWNCGVPMKLTTSDARDYAWFIWGTGLEGTWDVTEVAA